MPIGSHPCSRALQLGSWTFAFGPGTTNYGGASSTSPQLWSTETGAFAWLKTTRPRRPTRPLMTTNSRKPKRSPSPPVIPPPHGRGRKSDLPVRRLGPLAQNGCCSSAVVGSTVRDGTGMASSAATLRRACPCRVLSDQR